MRARSIPVITALPQARSGAARCVASRTFSPGLLVGLLAIAVSPVRIVGPGAARADGTTGAVSARRINPEQAIRRARDAHRQARRAEWEESGRSVDLYYEAVAFAYAGLKAAVDETGEVLDRELELYNDCVAGCLRTAARFGRLNLRSRLMIETPTGTIDVPVIHRGFVWPVGDFAALMNACPAPWNVSQRRPHRRCGLGAAEVVERPNPGLSPSDQYLSRRAFFPATAVLRPDLGPWLGRASAGKSPCRDVLELHDPIRTRCVELAGRRVPLSADFDAPLAFAHEAEQSRKSIREGFRDPDTQLDRVGIKLLEPYQPGKVLLLLIHGLRDDPFHFTDMIGALRSRPGFADRYQIAVFRYPTGDTFLRSAAQLRSGLRNLAGTFDSSGTDPGCQNMVLVGFSMGGLLAKLQVAWSGHDLWAKASPQPLDAISTDEPSRELLRAMFYFEPVSTVRRVIYIATPHDGASIPTQILGRTYTRVLRPPSDTHAMARQLERDNPGAILPFLKDMPSSLDLMSHERPFLRAMRRIAVNPATVQHTIAGTAYLPPSIAHGDGVMSLESAHVDGAASEALIAAIHTNICTNLDVIAEIERILQVHLDEMGANER
jgi:hypothetical protein